MLISKVFHRIIKYNNSLIRLYSAQNPYTKTWNIISKEIPVLFRVKKQQFTPVEHADIVIIGGGFIGASIAYWLKKRTGVEGLSVVVLEKDFTYKAAQQNLKTTVLTQHFSLPENILLSQFSADFLRNINLHLGDVNLEYKPTGSLVLASDKYAGKLEENVALQREYGLKNDLLTPEDISKMYPWLNLNDIKLGSMATESEGTFNSWNLLKGLVKKTKELGTTYIEGDVIGFEFEKQRDVLMEGVPPGSFERLMKVIYKTPDNEEHRIKFAACILAAGVESEKISKLAKIGTGSAMLSIPMPLEKREHVVYSITQHSTKTDLTTPLVMDTSGLWLRRNELTNDLLCGLVPMLTVDSKDLVEDECYHNIIKPCLINRVPSCNTAEINSYCTEIYDCTTYDDSGILGPHPYHNNLYLATGFGKYGCQHAPGIGRAIAELIIDSYYTTIDCTRFGFDRFLTGRPAIEFNVY